MSELIVKGIATSFVYHKMKLISDKGSGEGKLFIGAVSKSAEFDSFFEFGSNYKYKLDKQNLLNYMHEVKLEYVYQFFNKYQEANIANWESYLNVINSFETQDLIINLVKQADSSRYYIDQEKFNESDKLIFKNFIRKIIVPKLTNIVFEKNIETKEITLRLFVNYDFVKQDDISSGNFGAKINSFNRIIFGAPGTGKSHKLNNESNIFITQVNSELENELRKTLKTEFSDLTDNGSKLPKCISIGINYSSLICTYLDENGRFKTAEFLKMLGDSLSDEEKKSGTIVDNLKRGALGFKESKFSIKNTNTNHFLERVTFHPNYSYAQFVGTYKPIQDRENKDNIRYEYIPGPFMRIYVNAKSNPEKNFLLLIEEINRANVAAVFGDVFQLLDRQSDGTSQYPIAASEDQKNYLESCGINEDEISIPSNMYIWATMNSADQGVLPIDAAFKRRWDFEYLGIDDNEDSIKDYVLPISQKDSDGNISYTSENWNKIRHAINDKLKNIYGVNEDKLLGPYFLSKSTLDEAKQINCETETDKAEKICSLFKSKVLMYLYEDVVKMNPTELFNKSVFSEDKPLHYSDLCNKFDELGLKIFDEDFVK